MTAITFADVSYGYPDGPLALQQIDLAVDAGEILLVVGSSGSGKSTLLRAVNGIVPHSTGGRFAGDVTVVERSTREHRPRALADVVGFVHQDPEAHFVVDRVEADVAFVLENIGFSQVSMRRRVEEVLDALGIAHLRDRNPATLSGGERQRCAIAGALASAPSVLVLDEPTSQLDPQGAESVLAAVTLLNADLGTTVLIAEHRLERAAPIADRAVLVVDGRISVGPNEPGNVLAPYPGAPSVTRLGRLLGWDPLPLTVRDARRRYATHRPSLNAPIPDLADVSASGDLTISATGISVRLGTRVAVHDVDLDLHQGEVTALLGRNGSGKTTLLRALAGLTKVDKGTVTTHATIGFVPQDPNTLLFSPTVREEVRETLTLLGRSDNATVEKWIDVLGLHSLADRHPRSLSGGERQRVAIAAVAVGGGAVLLLDEPTRGMDAESRHALERAISAHVKEGGSVVLATHDIELAARCADRVVVMGDGDVVANGSARDVLSGSLFAPQVLRVMPPFLTVEEVENAMNTPSGNTQ